MRTFLLALVLVSLLAAPVLAGQRYGSPGLSTNGNQYSTQNGYGGHQVQGSNLNTGAQWDTTYNRGGVTQGTDSRGNSWQYDRNTGTYQNFGTGETRTRGQKW